MITWDSNYQIQDACELLKSLEGGVEVPLTDKRRETISIRGESGESTRHLNFHLKSTSLAIE